jgi:phosphopantothenoylcysteine synthetase/decarboxylase
MVPATYPTNSDGQMVVGKVGTPVAAERWLTWIPIKVNASPTISTGIHGTTGNIEGIPIAQEAVLTGLTEWVDYIPVAAVVDDDANAWYVSAAGFIPVIGTYA